MRTPSRSNGVLAALLATLVVGCKAPAGGDPKSARSPSPPAVKAKPTPSTGGESTPPATTRPTEPPSSAPSVAATPTATPGPTPRPLPSHVSFDPPGKITPYPTWLFKGAPTSSTPADGSARVRDILERVGGGPLAIVLEQLEELLDMSRRGFTKTGAMVLSENQPDLSLGHEQATRVLGLLSTADGKTLVNFYRFAPQPPRQFMTLILEAPGRGSMVYREADAPGLLQTYALRFDVGTHELTLDGIIDQRSAQPPKDHEIIHLEVRPHARPGVVSILAHSVAGNGIGDGRTASFAAATAQGENVIAIAGARTARPPKPGLVWLGPTVGVPQTYYFGPDARSTDLQIALSEVAPSVTAYRPEQEPVPLADGVLAGGPTFGFPSSDPEAEVAAFAADWLALEARASARKP